jgi:hypothetical protein
MNPLNFIADVGRSTDTSERKPYEAPQLTVLGAKGTDGKTSPSIKEWSAKSGNMAIS